MQALTFLFLLSTAISFSFANANVDPAWMHSAEIRWQGSAPSPKDDLGLSIYCGFAGFSKRTQVLISLQNRSNSLKCINPETLISPTASELKRIKESLPAMRTRLATAIAFSKLTLQDIFKQSVQTGFDCRILSSANPSLAKFTLKGDAPACAQSRIEFSPGDIYEASFSYAALVEVAEFDLRIPSACDSAHAASTRITFRCVR